MKKLSVKEVVSSCKITSCKGKDNCLEHCPCDCHNPLPSKTRDSGTGITKDMIERAAETSNIMQRELVEKPDKLVVGEQKMTWRDRLKTWIKTQHGTAGWEQKLESFIEEVVREEQDKLHRERELGYAGGCADLQKVLKEELSRLAEQVRGMRKINKTNYLPRYKQGYNIALLNILEMIEEMNE